MKRRSRIVLLVAAYLLAALALASVPVGTASAAASRSLSWPAGWRSPLPSATVSVTTNYGAYDGGCPNAVKTHGYTWYLATGRSEHLGLDLSAAEGTKVYAIADGRVTNAGALWGPSSHGVVLVQHFATNTNTFTAAYGHITIGKDPRTGAAWRAGDMVRKGEILGTVKTAGTGAHLHFGLASGYKTSVAPTSESSGTGNCTHQAAGTTNPESYLKTRSSAPLAGGIVGWKNSDGSITSWKVVSVSGVLRRYWIPSTTVYNCVRNAGGVDFGPMPSRFLDQLPDRTGYHASC